MITLKKKKTKCECKNLNNTFQTFCYNYDKCNEDNNLRTFQNKYLIAKASQRSFPRGDKENNQQHNNKTRPIENHESE